VRETLATHRPREDVGVLPVRYYLLTFDSRLSLTPPATLVLVLRPGSPPRCRRVKQRWLNPCLPGVSRFWGPQVFDPWPQSLLTLDPRLPRPPLPSMTFIVQSIGDSWRREDDRRRGGRSWRRDQDSRCKSETYGLTIL